MIKIQAAARIKASDNYKPMTYQEFKNSGRSDAEWDAYRIEQNKLSRERGIKRLLDGWRGAGISGSDVVNLLRSKDIEVPDAIKKVLEHDDTVVSSTSVTGRGLSRAAASKVHKWVSSELSKLH